MKRFISVLLAAIMLVSACTFALAEETIVQQVKEKTDETEAYVPEEGENVEEKVNSLFTYEEETGALPEPPAIDIALRDKAFDSAEIGDVVVVNGSMNIVKTAENVVFIMNVPAGYTCLTRDIEASIFAYIRIKDPEKLVAWLMENSMHLLLINDLDNSWVTIETFGSDAISTRVQNLTSLTRDRMNSYAVAFAQSYGITFNDIVESGSLSWMRFNDDILVTVVGGQYIIARWLEEEMTEDNLQDMMDLLSNLIIVA